MRKFPALPSQDRNIRMVSELRKGDMIVVWRIDLSGRTIHELIKLMVEWKEMGV